jgi:outer membrane protein assembly factor BamB
MRAFLQSHRTLLPALPLIVLATLVVVLAVVRARRAARHQASAKPVQEWSVPATDAGPLPSLAATRLASPSSARVSAAGARAQHGDAHRTHRARGKGPRTAKLAWKTDVGGPVQGQVATSPDQQALYVSTLGGKLVALARDGHVLFALDLHDRVYASPCVGDDGTIYVGSDGKKFYAVLPSGAVKWKLETAEEADTGATFAPNGTLVFAAGRTVYAVRPGGELAWRFQARKKVFTAPAVADDGTVYFGSQDHRAYALTSSGALLWTTDLGADVDGGPALADDGTVFFGTDGDEVVRMGPKGEVVWRAATGGFVRGPLSIGRDGDILAGVYGPIPKQIRVAAASGKLLGGFVVPGTGAREFGVHGGALEDDEGNLFFGGQDDKVHAVGRDGRLLWEFPTQGDVDAPLTLLEDGSLIVPSDDGNVYGLTP